MTARPGIALPILLLGWHVYAAEPQVDNVADIGRVFMTPEQRAELDRLREIRPAAVESGGKFSQPEDASPESAADASGYIIRAEGEAYLWVDGDFRKVRPDTVSDKPADNRIKIARHGELAAQPARDKTVGEHVDDESP